MSSHTARIHISFMLPVPFLMSSSDQYFMALPEACVLDLLHLFAPELQTLLMLLTVKQGSIDATGAFF